MSPLLTEFHATTSRADDRPATERVLEDLPGMTGAEWMIIALRDDGPGAVRLTKLYVPHQWRGRSFGRLGLRRILDLADKHHFAINSFVSPFGIAPTLKAHQLSSWYRRAGFKVRRDGTMTYQGGSK